MAYASKVILDISQIIDVLCSQYTNSIRGTSNTKKELRALGDDENMKFVVNYFPVIRLSYSVRMYKTLMCGSTTIYTMGSTADEIRNSLFCKRAISGQPKLRIRNYEGIRGADFTPISPNSTTTQSHEPVSHCVAHTVSCSP